MLGYGKIKSSLFLILLLNLMIAICLSSAFANQNSDTNSISDTAIKHLGIWNIVDTFVFKQQHWITACGFILTIVGLVLGYFKVKTRIDKFRNQAKANISIANLATTKALVEELITGKIAANVPLLQRKTIDLCNMLIQLSQLIPFENEESHSQLKNYIGVIRVFERQITNDMQLGSKSLDIKRYFSNLMAIKVFLLETQNAMNILNRGRINDSK
ncbi:exported hypothetical protein [Candidatus Zixiibacteriota bacterium]|nr:exported hypothetical protein [candidate division Zixibacteria bacterium]